MKKFWQKKNKLKYAKIIVKNATSNEVLFKTDALYGLGSDRTGVDGTIKLITSYDDYKDLPDFVFCNKSVYYRDTNDIIQKDLIENQIGNFNSEQNSSYFY